MSSSAVAPPSSSTRLVLFAYALSFPLSAVITALTLYTFLSHTNSVYGALHSALLLVITAPTQKGFLLSLRTSSLLSSSSIAWTLT